MWWAAFNVPMRCCHTDDNKTYLSANGVTDYFTTEIENGRRVLFTYQRANVDGMGTEDAGVESGYFDDGGPTADDLGLTEGGDDE